MVAVTAVVVLLDLPPAGAEFGQYQAAVRAGHDDGRLQPAGRWHACASDHAWEIRIIYSLGALALAAGYLWAVTGWTPGRPPGRRQRATA